MKLQPKRDIAIQVARQKKNEIDAGLALAQKVDALRRTKADEEANLDSFRKNAIAEVQREIDKKIQERDSLERKNIVLRQERITLHAPIDLKEEWEKVHSQKRDNESWKERLTVFEVQLIAKEADSTERDSSLDKRDSEVKEKEKLASRMLKQAQENHEESAQVLEHARTESQKLLLDAQTREKEVTIREVQAKQKEQQLIERERLVYEHNADLSNRERALKDKYETFIRAQNYVKKKNG